MSNTKSHYLDYYSAWVESLRNAKRYYDLKDVCMKGTAFIGIIQELKDSDLMTSERANAYITEVNAATLRKYNIFLN